MSCEHICQTFCFPSHVNLFPHSPLSFLNLILGQISKVVNLCTSCLDRPQTSHSALLPLPSFWTPDCSEARKYDGNVKSGQERCN